MHQDVITLPKFLAKMPRCLKGLPATVKGLKVGNAGPNDPVGLAREFERATSENPNGAAVVYEGRSLTYRELNAWANRWANFMSSQGIKKGDVVALFIENRPELLAAIIAVSKVGATNGMLNTSQRSKVLNCPGNA